MRRFAKTILLVFCAVALAAAEELPKLKVGFYVDSGSRGGGTLRWAQFLHYSPQFDVTLLDGQDLRNGKLDGLDLLVIPGGSSEKQCAAMGEEGKAAVRRLVAAGGKYVGICAGYHCALNSPGRIGLFPFVWMGSAGITTLKVELFDNAEKVLGIPKGNYLVRYSKGPIAKSAPLAGNTPATAEVLGVYRSSFGPAGKPEVNFAGTPAMLFGTYGKGKVIATSFHPELRKETWPIAFGCVYAMTGVRPTPQFPAKNARPVRVGYYSPTIIGKRCIREVLELDRERDIELSFVSGADLKKRELKDLDVMIFADGVQEAYRSLASRRKIITVFMTRGGRVLASGNGAEHLPGHRNLTILPVGTPFVEAALAARKNPVKSR